MVCPMLTGHFTDTMDTWDDEKLQKVVLSKGGNPRTTTDVSLKTLLCIITPPMTPYPRRSFANTSFKQSRVRSAFSCLLPRMSASCLTPSLRFGWLWECPNGENCQYRHALPPGFMLKSQRKAAEEAEKANTISLEEFLEVEVRLLQGC